MDITNSHYKPQSHMMNQRGGIAFKISHRFTGFWHPMTKHIMNQSSEVLTDAHNMMGGSRNVKCGTHLCAGLKCMMVRLPGCKLISYSRKTDSAVINLAKTVNKNMWVFPKIGDLQIINFNRVFHYKPSILGYPYFWKHPFHFI